MAVLPRPLPQLRPLPAHSPWVFQSSRCSQKRMRCNASSSSASASFSSASSATEQEHKAQLLMRRLQSKMAQKKKTTKQQQQSGGSQGTAAAAASNQLSSNENDFRGDDGGGGPRPAADVIDHAEAVDAARAAIAAAAAGGGGHGRAATVQSYDSEGSDESEPPSAAEQMWMEEFEGVVLRTHANMSVEVAGLTQAKQNSFVRFDDGSCGIVVRINTTSVTVALLEAGFSMGRRAQGRRLGNFGAAHSDDAEGVVKATSVKPFRFPFSSELLGRVWSPVGSPVIFDGAEGTAVNRNASSGNGPDDGNDPSKSLQSAREAVWMMRKADVTIPAVFPNTALYGRKSGFLDAAKVRDQVLTGMPLIDSLYPIGYGSRVSVQASSGAGALESSIATNIVSQFCSVQQQDGRNSVASPIENESASQGARSDWAEDFPENVCVYVCVGKSQAQHREILRALKAGGALENTIVIAANPNQLIDFGAGAGSSGGNHSTLEYLAPFIGNSLAMQLRDQGCRVLAVYDDLSNHVRATLDFAQVIGRSGTIVPQVEQVCVV